jgi:hypothetical protein
MKHQLNDKMKNNSWRWILMIKVHPWKRVMINRFLKTNSTKKEAYSIEKGREKRDQNAPERCKFEDMAHFAIVASS